MKSILAHWCYINNFGDALNPYMLSILSGRKVRYVNYKSPNYIKEIYRILRNIMYIGTYDFNRLVPPSFYKNKKVILGIGSIISRSQPNHQIWGSGYMSNYKEPLRTGGTFYAVRGRYTSDKLVAEGYPACTTFGDPALLLPLVYTPITKKQAKIGFVPHIKDLPDFIDKYPEYKIINLTTSNKNTVEDIINDINSCEYILSTSLHGIIVAHAYGIPAFWIKNKDIDTDGLKFYDYFDSVGIQPYNGISDFSSILISPEEFFQTNHAKVLPSESLDGLQKNLLKVAPFKLIKKYQSLIDKTL